MRSHATLWRAMATPKTTRADIKREKHADTHSLNRENHRWRRKFDPHVLGLPHASGSNPSMVVSHLKVQHHRLLVVSHGLPPSHPNTKVGLKRYNKEKVQQTTQRQQIGLSTRFDSLKFCVTPRFPQGRPQILSFLLGRPADMAGGAGTFPPSTTLFRTKLFTRAAVTTRENVG